MQFLKYALAAFSIGSAAAAPALGGVTDAVGNVPVAGDAVNTAVGTVTKVADVQVLLQTVSKVKSTVEGELSSIRKLPCLRR